MTEPVFHLATVAAWLAAQRSGAYTTSTLGRSLAEEGFIHASRAEQWQPVRERFYGTCTEPLVLLTIDPERLDVPLRYEAADGAGDTFPHLYGPLDPAAVTEVVVVANAAEPRSALPLLADERTSLEGWLDFMRATVPLKLDGLRIDELARRAIAPSTLSPIGLVRHLAEVERYWADDIVAGVSGGTSLYCEADPDGDFNGADADSALQDYLQWSQVVQAARDTAAAVADLDEPLGGLRRGEPVNLRWVLTHLIEEYARHLGHLDLLREAIDGRTGY